MPTNRYPDTQIHVVKYHAEAMRTPKKKRIANTCRINQRMHKKNVSASFQTIEPMPAHSRKLS